MALASALVHGTSMGGARPKALIADGDTELLAKFSTSGLTAVRSKRSREYRTGPARGLDVSGRAAGAGGRRDACLIERFDRPGGGRQYPGDCRL